MIVSKPFKTVLLYAGAVLTLIVAVKALSKSNEEKQQPMAAQVTVAQVISERLTEWDEFTGRIQAPQTVEIRPRVSGYIEFMTFEEGSIVQEGDALFAIDNRPFKAEVKRLEADLADANSQYALAVREYQRATELAAKKVMSVEMLDSRLGNKQQTMAKVQSVKAALELAKLNLGYTHVKAPITGRVSNEKITKGNYVTAGQSILTTIVSTQKAYAYFDADEQTYLKYRELAKQGRRSSSRDSRNPVFMGLASDHDFPYAGVIDFIDNKIDPATGTIRARAVFDNADGSLIPGLFARIRLAGSNSYQGILIDGKAIGTDLNNKYVLVLNADNTVQYRRVTLGEKLNGLRIIKSGLQAGEKIVINGLQRVRPGSPVTPIEGTMSNDENLAQIRARQAQLDTLVTKEQLVRYARTVDSAAVESAVMGKVGG